MFSTEATTLHLYGMYHDVLRDPRGTAIWDSGWRKNTIVVDCRRLLAGFMHGAPTGALGLQGLQVGAGDPVWDQTGPPLPDGTQTALVDHNPFTVPRASLQINYLTGTGSTVSGTPTNQIQIVAQLGPNVPTWPDANHPVSTLREFGLVGQLDSTTVLINYVRHVAIVKDPASTLVRTIWLAF